MSSPILEIIRNIPLGFSEGYYAKRRYGITKTVFNNGNSFKVYAEELGGSNFVSLNCYIITGRELLKPCEMPKKKVVHFLENVVIRNKYEKINYNKYGNV